MENEKFMKWTIVVLVALLVLSLIHNYRKFNDGHKEEKKIKIDFNVKLPRENYYGMDYENYTGAF